MACRPNISVRTDRYAISTFSFRLRSLRPRVVAGSALMSAHVVVLNGPAGVGKTTVGRQLAAHTANGVCLVGDSIREFVITRDRHRPTGLAFRATAALIEVYAEAGFERIVFEGPEHLRPFRVALSPALDFTLITLWTEPEVLRARKVARGRGDEDVTDRVGHRLDLTRANLAELGIVVPTDNGVADIVTTIERLLASPS